MLSQLRGGVPMPIETVVAIIAVAMPFVVFSVVLALVDFYTTFRPR
jgi:hypothetical protein